MIGIALKLLGIGRWIWSAIRAGIKWALSDWRHLVIVVVGLFAAYQMLEAGKYQRAHGKAVVALERANKTVADMTAASEAAKQAALANAKRVELEYKEIADNAKITYNRALAYNRATVDRWLQNRRGATGQSGSATSAEVSTGIAGTETLPVISRGFVILPESDLGKIADIQATLYALQQAAREVERLQTVPD